MSDGSGAFIGIPLFIFLLLMTEGIERTVVAGVLIALTLLALVMFFVPSSEERRDRE